MKPKTKPKLVAAKTPQRSGDVLVDHAGEYRDPITLNAHPKNSRKHSVQQIDMLAASLEKYGFTKPVLVDEHDTIIAGHGAVQAAIKVGMGQVPVIVAVNWSDEDKRGYLIADNRLGERSRWDYGLLAVELDGLKSVTDVAALGFTKAELSTALRRQNSQPPPSSGLGALQYRIVIDCTDEKHQAELLARFAKEGFTCRALIS